MDAIVKTREVGGSLVVTIPREIVKAEEIIANEMIEIEVGKLRRDFFGALKGIGPFTEADELTGHD